MSNNTTTFEDLFDLTPLTDEQKATVMPSDEVVSILEQIRASQLRHKLKASKEQLLNAYRTNA